MADQFRGDKVLTGMDRFKKREVKRSEILSEKVSISIEHNNSEIGTEFRSFNEWRDAFNDVASSDGGDKRANGAIREFLSDKYTDQRIDEVLHDKEKAGSEKPTKELRKEFTEWLVFKQPWEISDIRVVAGSVIFNEENWRDGGSLSKYLGESMGVNSFNELQQSVDSGEFDKDLIIKQYLLALSNNSQKETLRSMALVARESYKQPDLQKEASLEWMDFNLKPNTSVLDRLTSGGGNEGKEIQDKIRKFTEFYKSGSVSEVSFGVYNNQIDSIGLVMNNGDKVSLSLPLFIKIFDGAEYLRSEKTGEPIGIRFRSNDKTADIKSDTPSHVSKKILMSVAMSSEPIGNEFSVNMVRFTKGEKRI